MSLDETALEAITTVKELKMDEFTVVQSDAKTAANYAVEAIPLNLVIDKEGVIRFRAEGKPKEQELTKLVEDLLKELPPEKEKK
jgi:hypothetical protein